MSKRTHLNRMLAVLVSVAMLLSCASVAGWSVAADTVPGTAYHYAFDVNSGLYYGNAAQTAAYYGTAGTATNNAIQDGAVDTRIVAEGNGYAMQMAYTGNRAATADKQRYASFSLPNYHGEKKNGRNPGQTAYLEQNASFKITVRYKVTGCVSAATLYVATYSGSYGGLNTDKTFGTEFARHTRLARIESTTDGWQTASALYAPGANGGAYLLLKMDDDTNRIGTSVLIGEVDIQPVKAVSVSFDTKGGTFVSAVMGVEGDPITYPTAPTRNGYQFLGWVTDAGADAPTHFPAENLTLTATWKAAGSFVQDFDSMAADARLDLNGRTNGWNENNYIKVTTEQNATVGGAKAVKVSGTDATSGQRAQMLVKDGANAQIYVEAGKNYRLSFYYYIPDTEADYALNYWFAAADNENRFDYASNSIATARLVETSIADPIKGQWTLVTVNVKNAAYSGKLRLGLCASTASAANRYTFYIDDIGVVECADFIPDPEVESFESYTDGTKLALNGGSNTITASAEQNHTENGVQAAKVVSNTNAGGTRPQMMVKDGTGAQVMVEARKNYTVTFYYYVPSSEVDYKVNYWLTATEDEVCFTESAQKNAAVIAEYTAPQSAAPVERGVWHKVTLDIKNCAHSGKLRIGLCASVTSASTFYVDDIYVKEYVEFVPDPQVESFENYPVDTVLDLNPGTNTILVSDGQNNTENGTKAALVTSTTNAGGIRAQMMVKDGTGAQVMVEAGKNYTVAFRYFIPITEGDFNVSYWLAATQNEVCFTDTAQKNATAIAEITASATAAPAEKGVWHNVTVEIGRASYSGKLRLGICANQLGTYRFYVDDIKVMCNSSNVDFDPNATVWDFENYDVGEGRDGFLHGTGSVSDEFNHTDGGSKSLMVNTVTQAGIDRTQMVILNPATGKPYELKKGEQYTLTFWVYMPELYGDLLGLNYWLLTADTIAKINNKDHAEYDMGTGSQTCITGEWYEIQRTFTVEHGKYLIMGITDRSAAGTVFYLDDICVKTPEYMTVKFDTNGSKDTFDDIRAVVGAVIPFDGIDPYRLGYKFTGWYTDKACKTESFYDIAMRPLEGKDGDVLTLYAGWTVWEGDPVKDDKGDKKEPTVEYRVEYYDETVWVGDQNIPQPLDFGTEPQLKPETVPDAPADEPTAQELDAEDGLPTWLIFVIVIAAVLVVGGGAMVALLLSKKKKTANGLDV